jgi:hypothetical protein
MGAKDGYSLPAEQREAGEPNPARQELSSAQGRRRVADAPSSIFFRPLPPRAAVEARDRVVS